MDITVYQNPTGMLDQGEQKEKKGAYYYFCWFFQILVWIMIILCIVLNVVNSEAPEEAYIILGIIYVIYLILEFCSSTSKYLLNKNNDQHMYENMGRNFRALPVIKFHGECYHYKTVHYTTRDNHGNVHHHTRREKVTTHTETFTLPYYSERDVSGLFYLNCNMAYVRRKCYIKLNLKEEINFADEISCMDYEKEKDSFWKRNKNRDRYFDFKETREIPGMKHHNLVKLNEQEPYFSNFLFFTLFTLLTFSEFYKSWFDTFCVYQKFKIRKLVSTRYDLNQLAYQGLIPQLDCIDQHYSYQPEYYNYINPDQKAPMPTPGELENAKQYQDRIPNYQTLNNYGSTQPGLILNIPRYGNPYDEASTSQPPPAFASTSQPPSAFASTSQPPPAFASTSHPPPVFASTSQPPPAFASTSQPPPAIASTSQPPPAIASTSQPPSAIASTSQPPSAITSTSQPPSAIASTSNAPNENQLHIITGESSRGFDQPHNANNDEDEDDDDIYPDNPPQYSPFPPYSSLPQYSPSQPYRPS